MFDGRQRLTGARSTPTIGSMASRSRRWLFVLAAAALLVGSGGVTSAHHGGRAIGSLFNCDRPGVFPPRCTSVAGDLRHRVFFDTTLTDGLASSLRDAMAEDYDPTDLAVTEVDELTPATDVVAYSQDYGDVGAAAWVYCPTDAPQGVNSEGDRWCRMQEIHFNLNGRYAVFFEDDGSRDHVACHEFGHTVGLRHWGNPPDSVGPSAATCMNANTPNGPTELHQNDVDHINAYHYVAPPPSRRMELVSQPTDRMGPIADAGVEALESERYASLRALTRALGRGGSRHRDLRRAGPQRSGTPRGVRTALRGRHHPRRRGRRRGAPARGRRRADARDPALRRHRVDRLDRVVAGR